MNTAGTSATGAEIEPAWVGEVLRFWFGEVGDERWFARSAVVDTQIHERFRALHESLLAQDGFVEATPRVLLAAVLVLDQFSRHLFRDSPRAYAADPLACRLSRAAVGAGFDRSMSARERLFLYMPFQHSEAREDQVLSVQLCADLGNEEWMRYAVVHKEIIDRFGRFPHRNAILGRQSSAEEVALLREPMGSF
jgi:uncharacterized protein (DUF924 family)